jgi:hypothetical protein
MSEQSRFHVHITWAKERLDEMEAALALLETQAHAAQAAARAKTDQLIADLRKRRGEFRQAMHARQQADEATWQRDKAQLETQWAGFAAEVNKYLEAIGKEVAVRQAMFRDLAAVQRKAWSEAGEQLHDAATRFAADRRAEVETAVQQLKADASKAEARLQKLMGGGSETLAALTGALADSRAAFDRAVQTAGDVFKRAAQHTAEGKAANRPPA